MNFFRIYWQAVKGRVLFGFLCVLIFLFTFYLYRLPLGAVLYPAALCLVGALVTVVLDYRRTKKKFFLLVERCGLPPALLGTLPKAATPEEAAYQAILASLQQQDKETQNRQTRQYRDMVDYYTIWAHQIKTPIASMRLTLQNQNTAFSRQLLQELQRIEQYVEMVLAFLRLDSSSTDYVFREQDLDAIIREAVKKFAGQFIQKKIRLEYAPIHVQVLTDEKWLAFVLEQILSNALKYTREGSVAITLEEPLTLCIRDTGIGIAPEDLPRVFEKSYTGYNGRNDKKASGIGLYLCRRICGNLGHGISIDSELNRGTAVRLDLSHRTLQVE